MTANFLKHPMVTTEKWENFSEVDHHTWYTLFKRQSELLQNRAVPEILFGMKKLEICDHRIPKFSELNEILWENTKFSIVPVTGLIPEDLFFYLLSERKFPSTCFIRKLEQLDYLEEPDIFHDVFGHVPLLVNPIFADFMEVFGRQGLKAIERGLTKFAATLYWYTVEFGLIQTTEGTRIYGAGITSSIGESLYSLESEIPVRIKFNLPRLLNTLYHTDSFQKTYFVVQSFQELFHAMETLDWQDLQDRCAQSEKIDWGVLLDPSEKIDV